MREAYYITIEELLEQEEFKVPEEMQSGEHLIYSSPATLSYNSPGAQGFGVKRAGLVIPESVMLLIAPACCGRNTTILGDEGGYSHRMFFLQMDESDIVTGRHLSVIPEAIEEILGACDTVPKVVVLCITCVDALLGTDLDRVCRKAEAALEDTKYAGVHVVPSYMYALTREGKNPPMVAIRDTIYSLIQRKNPKMNQVNLLGNFTHLEDDCELYDLLRQLGLEDIREVGRCKTLEEYQEMGDANFNLILNPEARKAAYGLDERLGMPYAELTRLYQLDRIQKQYQLFASALGASFELDEFHQEAEAALQRMQQVCRGKTFAIGQVVNGNPVEMALALSKLGLEVQSVFANISDEDYPYIRELGTMNPSLRIYSTLSPTMMNYDGDQHVDISIGVDAAFYYPKSINVKWNNEIQPFGYRGLQHFAEAVTSAVTAADAAAGTGRTSAEFASEAIAVQESSLRRIAALSETMDTSSEMDALGQNQGNQSMTSGMRLLSTDNKKKPAMKGLRKFISPFTPDQSGAESVLFGYGGMLIIMDAGGCVGNVCGYDEPRWGAARSAIFSAGLRDLDAILGRDELLIRKIRTALADMECNFIGLIGTPVPATIATDYRALKRLMEREFGIPVLPVETNGIELYDRGQEKAYQWLFREFLEPKVDTTGTNSSDKEESPFVGILGATPLDCTAVDSGDEFRQLVSLKYGMRAVVYGMGDRLEDVKKAAEASRNIVVSPSGLKMARILQEDYGIPYDVGYPVKEEERNLFLAKLEEDRDQRILVVHQQVFGNEIRKWIRESGITDAVDVASWFKMYGEIKEEGDFVLADENDFLPRIIENKYDVVIGDPLLRRALPGWNGKFRSIPHFPISGELHSARTTAEYWKMAGDRL